MKRNGTMKKMKFLTAGLIAAMMVPAAAQAQTREIREDRRDAREERRELRDAQRYGDRKSVVQGKSVSVRVDLGGRRIIKKKKKHLYPHNYAATHKTKTIQT